MKAEHAEANSSPHLTPWNGTRALLTVGSHCQKPIDRPCNKAPSPGKPWHRKGGLTPLLTVAVSLLPTGPAVQAPLGPSWPSHFRSFFTLLPVEQSSDPRAFFQVFILMSCWERVAPGVGGWMSPFSLFHSCVPALPDQPPRLLMPKDGSQVPPWSVLLMGTRKIFQKHKSHQPLFKISHGLSFAFSIKSKLLSMVSNALPALPLPVSSI